MFKSLMGGCALKYKEKNLQELYLKWLSNLIEKQVYIWWLAF
jgi:hypothetical protein